ncbi:hypothetical protein FLONG3_6784 [Fusarium longipes]|uniref:Nucleoside phosphorylase domain-containing protein n=1 Tax=Fusarium longipes TaxID=694270 RepID=A0A395SIZ8_9HYPO|nr:hypothetical protein FLONG3_6784 [Fusarium longipes]
MTFTQRPSNRKSFRIAISWDDEGYLYGRADGDTNTYITGRIGQHNIVLAVLPSIGTNSAAASAASLRSSYTNVKLAILVGVCGGVPRVADYDVLLGDVVVSKTIVQYDYGKQHPGHFEVRNVVEDSLGRASKDVRSLMVVLETEFMRERLQTEASKHLKHLQQEAAKKKRRRANYQRPGMKEDKLYPSGYTHRHWKGCIICAGDPDIFCEVASKASCVEVGCDPATLVKRERFEDLVKGGEFCPEIFVGCIGSGNTVIKSGMDRDRIAAAHNLIAFEMEGAGAWDEIPCIIVKGVCDYADSHKNKVWQDFAAATAASVTKAILGQYAVHDGDRDMSNQRLPACIISDSQFRDGNFINQGNIQGNVYYSAPLPPRPPPSAARTEVVRVIPYPRNEDLVYRPDATKKLDELLPQTSGFHSAALWGLDEGVNISFHSKTQIALDYAYRRCDADEKCCVFWVHADSEATFLADYKTIGKKLGVDERLDVPELFVAVRNEIEARPNWLMILDNADNLKLFGVGQDKEKEKSEDLYKNVPRAPQGTVLWTSRDAHIAGTLVGAPRGVEVQSMAVGEATALLSRVLDEPPMVGGEASREDGVDALLEELQCLPLAISQAGAYMRRMSMSAEEYLSLLRSGKTRWKVLEISDTDRHRRPEVSNSVLETWRISTERIRLESEMSYQVLHIIAYMDNQDIPQDLMLAAASKGHTDGKDSPKQDTELGVLEAVARLREFSFLSLRQTVDDGGRRYEMHKLVQEAIRYGLGVRDFAKDGRPKEDEAYYCRKALQVVDGLFPNPEPTSWILCERYVSHAVRVSEWAEISATEVATASLLERVSHFLYDRGRWRERVPIASRALDLRQKVLGERDPDTISSMVILGTTYHAQGRYDEAHEIVVKALDLQQEVLGEQHPWTIDSRVHLAAIYQARGQYNRAEAISKQTLDICLNTYGEKRPSTINSMAALASTYQAQGQYHKAETLREKVLNLRREILGEKHLYTIASMSELAATYHARGRYKEDQEIAVKVLVLRQEVLGENHPDTISSMADLAISHYAQGQYDKAQEIVMKVLELRQETLGEKHPCTIKSMVDLATTYHAQGQHGKAEDIYRKALSFQLTVLGERHPDTLNSMAALGTACHSQGRYDEAVQFHQTALDLRRDVLGENHPDTVRSAALLASTQEALRQPRSVQDQKPWTRLLWKFIHQKSNSSSQSRSSRMT